MWLTGHLSVLQAGVREWDSSMAGFGQSSSASVLYSARLLKSRADRRQSDTYSSGVDRRGAAPGAYLITGGVGALGTLMATWLESQDPAAQLMLCSRSGRTAASAVPLQQLMQSSCCLVITR